MLFLYNQQNYSPLTYNNKLIIFEFSTNVFEVIEALKRLPYSVFKPHKSNYIDNSEYSSPQTKCSHYFASTACDNRFKENQCHSIRITKSVKKSFDRNKRDCVSACIRSLPQKLFRLPQSLALPYIALCTSDDKICTKRRAKPFALPPHSEAD